MTRFLARTLAAAAIAGSFSAGPLAAQDFTAVNHLDVQVSGPQQITVFGPTELWARDYWCAAGDIAFRKLRLGITDRLMVTRAYMPEDQSVVFGVGAGKGPGVLILGQSVRNEGSSLRVGHARGFCGDRNLSITQ